MVQTICVFNVLALQGAQEGQLVQTSMGETGTSQGGLPGGGDAKHAGRSLLNPECIHPFVMKLVRQGQQFTLTVCQASD